MRNKSKITYGYLKTHSSYIYLCFICSPILVLNLTELQITFDHEPLQNQRKNYIFLVTATNHNLSHGKEVASLQTAYLVIRIIILFHCILPLCWFLSQISVLSINNLSFLCLKGCNQLTSAKQLKTLFSAEQYSLYQRMCFKITVIIIKV